MINLPSKTIGDNIRFNNSMLTEVEKSSLKNSLGIQWDNESSKLK